MKDPINWDELFNRVSNPSQRYHVWAKNRKKTKNLPYSSWPETWKTVYFKNYVRFEAEELPGPGKLNISLEKALMKRKSARNFSEKPLTKKQISTVLYYSAGLKDNKSKIQQRNRFYPSGGARYPLEVYLLSINSNLPKGLYHYYLKDHSLERLLMDDKISLKPYVLNKEIEKSGILIIVTAVFKRSTIKYQKLGYRFALLEAGHLGQNFYLAATAAKIKCVAVGGVVDTKLEKLLDIDGINESIVYALAIGN